LIAAQHQGETLLGCGVWGDHPVQLPREWQPRRWLTFEQQEHDREVELLHPPVERIVVLHRLLRAEALLAKQDEGCCLGDFLGKLRQPEATGTQALGREKETRIGVLGPQRRIQSTALEPLRVPMTRVTRHERVAGYRIRKDHTHRAPQDRARGRACTATVHHGSLSRAS